MSEQVDDAFELEALRRGASYALTTPLTIDVIVLLRQRVVRKRMQEENGYGSKRKYIQSSNDEQGTMKKRFCISWTPKLHEKFLHAVNILGDESKNSSSGRFLSNSFTLVMCAILKIAY